MGCGEVEALCIQLLLPRNRIEAGTVGRIKCYFRR